MTHAALRLRAPGTRTVTLRPGRHLSIGRHATNTLVLADPSVSRFHARVTWPAQARRPEVQDLGSANGTLVDGRLVRGRVPLLDGSLLTVGDVTLGAELDENVDVALLEDSGEGSRAAPCRLFSEGGPEPQGVVPTRQALVELLLELEAGRRTGTLALERGQRHGRVVLADGLVVDALTDMRSGPPALGELLELMPGARYSFRAAVEPREAPMWISFKRWLEAQHLATSRLRPRWTCASA